MTSMGEGLPPGDSTEVYDPAHHARLAAIAALKGGR